MGSQKDTPPRRIPSEFDGVLLVGMPFGLILTPSLALGLLQASILPLGIPCRQSYLSLRFARRIGRDAYRAITERWEIGDWVFAEAAFPDRTLPPASAFLDSVVRSPPRDVRPALDARGPLEAERALAEWVKAAEMARRAASDFLEEAVELVRAWRPRIVGFSCLFQQRVPAIALARRLRAELPELTIVFGGPECQEARGAELLRQVPAIDAVVSGAGEVVFPELVRRALSDQPIDGLPGVYTRGAIPAGPEHPNAPLPARLDELPYPCFDDFFSECAELDLPLPPELYLSLESSRGCWWGDHPKRHCTFCGLNGSDLGFVAKSPGRVVSELEHFARCYPGRPLVMTDSILPMSFLDSVLPELARRRLGVMIQYETRVTLDRPQLEALAGAGVTQIQPGIESLSTEVLTLMRKRTTAIQNVQLLKWARELGMEVLWNLLGGFPGESPGAYGQMAALVPKICHLPPPSGFRWVSLARFSPMFEDPARFGIQTVEPAPAYEYILPFDRAARMNLATSFVSAEVPPPGADRYTAELQREVAEWRRGYPSAELIVVEDESSHLVVDRRPMAPRRVQLLTGLERALHSACHRVRGLEHLAIGARSLGASSRDVEQALRELEGRGLLLGEGDRWLSLATRLKTQREVSS